MSDPTLVILAGGIGSRYGGLKQADPIGPNGELIIHYSVYDALNAGFGHVVFLIRRDIEEAFRERIGNEVERHTDVTYVFQDLDNVPAGFAIPDGRSKPWGTGHAVLCCKDAVHGNFAAINADDFYGTTAFAALADHLRTAADTPDGYAYSMVGYVLRNTLSEYGHVARRGVPGGCGRLPDRDPRTPAHRAAAGRDHGPDGGRQPGAVRGGQHRFDEHVGVHAEPIRGARGALPALPGAKRPGQPAQG